MINPTVIRQFIRRYSTFRGVSIVMSWLWLLLLALTPLSLALLVSFCSKHYPQLFTLHFTWTNYRQLLCQPAYLVIMLRSLKIALGCSLCTLLLGYPFAYCIASAQAKWQPPLLLLVIIPFWMSSLVRVYAIMILLKHHGVLNWLLLKLGVISQPLQFLYTNSAVLMGLTYDFLPLMILPIYLSISKIDRRYLEAARDLGATPAAIFWRIVLPLSRNGIITGCLMVFLPSITMFYVPALLGGARALLLGNLIEQQFLTLNNWPMGAAISSTLILLMLLMVLVQWLHQYSSGLRAKYRRRSLLELAAAAKK